ncbi:ABC transporter substrate-binding protein [Mesorhizobium sp. M0195]
MWYIAQEKGFFKANGLEGVELTNFVEDKDMGAAVAAGQVDGDNESIQQLLAKVQAGIPIKGVLLLDASTKADAILVNSDIKTVADLKGKQVAFERGSTSDLLLNYVLQKNGMTIDDVNVLPMPAASAGTAIISGTVPAAVTYEPYISAAVAADKNIKVLAEAGEAPGLIQRRARRSGRDTQEEAGPGTGHAEELGPGAGILSRPHRGRSGDHRQGRRRRARRPRDCF